MRRCASATLLVALVLLAGCASTGEGSGDPQPVRVTGSATAAPVVAEAAADGDIDVVIDDRGTGSGFEALCAGEADIAAASTAIPGPGARVDHVSACAANGVEYVEVPIALDALALVRHRDNAAVGDLTTAELGAIWSPGSTVRTWADVRPGWPEAPIGLYGRLPGSGSLDTLTDAVTGRAGAIRPDHLATDDLDELAAWIADDEFGLGFMGVGNYLSAHPDARDRLTTVPVDGVAPGLAEVQSARYPMARPLLLYVSVAALERPEVDGLVRHHLAVMGALAPRVYVYALPDEAYALATERLDRRAVGSVYGGDPFPGPDVVTALRSS